MSLSSFIENIIILDGVCEFLHATHLLQCVLVSKEWRYYFAPKLWSLLDLNWHHIDSISAFHATRELSPDIINFPKLQHAVKYETVPDPFSPDLLARIHKPYMSTWSNYHLELLSGLIDLKSLHLFIQFRNPKEPIYRLPDALNCLRSLRELDISIVAFVQPELLQHIIESVYHCETVHIAINVDTADSQQINNLRDSVERLPTTQIKDLMIKTIQSSVDLSIAVPLLRKSPRMTCFYLCDPYTVDTLQQASNILLGDSHHHLEYLGIEEAVNHLQDNIEYWDTIHHLFQSLSNNFMGCVRRPELCFKHTLFPESRECPGDDRSRYLSSEDIILRVYPRCFSETLTSLELEGFSIDRLIILLCRLPLLLNLSAYVFQEAPLFYPTPNVDAIDFQKSPLFTNIPAPVRPGDYRLQGFEYGVNGLPGTVESNLVTALSRVSWSCQGIKSIKLWISYVRLNDYTKAFLDCLFCNIGRLYQLEELTLGAENEILTTSTLSLPDVSNEFPGYFVFLKDLKQLSRVNLRNYGMFVKRFEISFEDILFMINSWPDLQHLSLQSICLLPAEKSKIADVVRKHGISLNMFNDMTHIVEK